MKLETLFLKIIVCMLGIFALCLYVMPWVANDPEWLFLPFLIGMYVPAIPFIIALVQSFKLLRAIDKNLAFSEAAVKALKTIKFCAFTIGILYAVALPFLFHFAQADDAPGLAALGLFLTFTPIVIAVFASLLQKLVKNAIDKNQIII